MFKIQIILIFIIKNSIINMNKKTLFEEIVEKVFEGSDPKLIKEGDSVYSYAAKQALSDRLNAYNDKNGFNMGSYAKNFGISLDNGAARNKYREDMLKKYGSYEAALKSMNPEIKAAIDAMKKLKDPTVSKEEKNAIYRRYGGASGLQRYKDMLDKMSLTPTYDVNNTKESGINVAPFGTNYKAVNSNGEEYLSKEKPMATPEKLDKKGMVKTPYKPADKIVGYDYENLDLTDVPIDDILKYFKSGTRSKKYGNMVDMIRAAMEEAEKNGGEIDENTQNMLDGLKNLYFKAEFNKLLNSKFGYDFRIPTSIYTYGNSKLPDDTLVINFTSAHRCPAWNECLVGYACYARGSEHNYEGLHNKNSNLHLMWAASHDDPELLKAMFRVIKMYLVNPGIMASTLLKNPLTSEKWINFLNNYQGELGAINAKSINANINNNSIVKLAPFQKDKNVAADDDEMYENTKKGKLIEASRRPPKPKRPKGASDMLGRYIYNSNFSDIFDKKDLKVIRTNPRCLKGHFIRLNEEGDFIGQWLLDAVDDLAGELKLLGISTTAYTCRNLNYTKIKNIILNASTLNVGTKGEKEGEVSNSIARRFFAVSTELYNKLEDTYVPSGRKLRIQRPENPKDVEKGDWDGTKELIPLSSNGRVKYDLKPFTLTNLETNATSVVQYTDRFDPSGNPTVKNRLYYKCPCGRHGDVLKNGKPIKMNCYLCRMCYEPKNQNVGEIYVLVEVHGDNIDSFNMNKANNARGIDNTMSTYREAREIFNNRLSEQHAMSEKLGMKMISQYGINSVKTHLSEIAANDSINREMAENTFKNFINRINESDKKNQMTIID